MAIFRAGKRIGPFDIRGGISRGDFKSSAYHKTDRDPRFKMQANVDNTIGRFRSAMASAEGYARPARFAIRVFPPVNLKHQLGLTAGTVYSNGQVKIPEDSIGDMNGADAGFDQGVSGKYMNDLLSTYGRQVNIHCDSVNLAARLEAQTRNYKDENGKVTPVLYSSYTQEKLENIKSIEVDKIKVKGKEELITIYKPI